VRQGKVVLVGAGPGDPDLITVRGAAALREADAVVYDALASLDLLRLAPPEAERINVGKRGHDEPTRSQPEITALLLRLAGQGKTVVRLKGGDPFVFGRGAEEASACAEAGVPFEVVPGVSSVIGALAYAGIPVTDRRYSASFAVVTGHSDPTLVTEQTRWKELARAPDTLVILMGMQNLESLIERVIDGGRSPATPAAVVMNGTLPSQRVVVAPLAELGRKVREAQLGTPAVVVIGDVVRLREVLAWYERRPLFGTRVLVTRAADQAEEMVDALRDAGAQAVVVPMIRVAPPASFSSIDAALTRLSDYTALLFTSANAVRCFAGRALERGASLEQSPPIACVGPVTARAARAVGLAVALVPETRHDAVGLLEVAIQRWPPAGRSFLLPQAERARETLASGLKDRGAVVDAVTAYRTVAADVDGAALRRQLAAGELDALTFASPSTVNHFVELLDDASRAAASRCLIAGIGPATADALRGVGLIPDVVSERSTARELVAELAALVLRNKEGEGA
jgi:uroporphyrinogen III methyltransferase/synthase